jgi:hypothetical protein
MAYNGFFGSTPADSKQSDISTVLDRIAFHSPLLNMPEQQESYWPTHLETLTAEDARVFDEYRVKFGMEPKASLSRT